MDHCCHEHRTEITAVMTKQKSSTVLAFILAALPISTILAAQAAQPGDPDGPGLNTALVDSSAEVYGSIPGTTSNDLAKSTNRPLASVRLVRTYVPACEGNVPGSPDSAGTLCPRAVELCAGTPDPTDLGFWVFTAPAGADPQASESWTATGEFACRGAADEEEPAALEPVVTAEDFRRLPLPPAEINVQPPNGRTLINVPTNLYTDADSVILPTTVLGQPVRVRATPRRFRWSYGDGAALATADPGAPYPNLRTAHTYRKPGRRTLGLTTTYSGEYSVAGGAWIPIDGLATVDSPGAALTVLSARNELVGEPLP